MAPFSGRFCVSLITDENADIAAAIEATIAKLDQVKQEIGRVIFGQEGVVQDTLITLLAGGHALLVGVPGLAKTRLAETLGVVLGLAQKRVQFTPDLMPADILGSEVLDDAGTGRQSFRFIPGPIFAQLLMADEINRASPRTQAALLQAMQERKVTVAGQDHAAARAVPRPRDPEPDRAGGHLPAARGAARPVLHADQRRLSLARGRAADDHRHHHRHRGPGRSACSTAPR